MIKMLLFPSSVIPAQAGIHYPVIANDLSAIAEATAEAKQSQFVITKEIAALGFTLLAMITIAAPSLCEAVRQEISRG